MSPLYAGPMWAWTCRRCGRVWHMQAGVKPPPTGCGNYFAGCAGREAPCERKPELDYEAREAIMPEAHCDQHTFRVLECKACERAGLYARIDGLEIRCRLAEERLRTMRAEWRALVLCETVARLAYGALREDSRSEAHDVWITAQQWGLYSDDIGEAQRMLGILAGHAVNALAAARKETP